MDGLESESESARIYDRIFRISKYISTVKLLNAESGVKYGVGRISASAVGVYVGVGKIPLVTLF